jgi:hypothetical protein
MSETLKEGTRVFDLHFSDRTGYIRLKGRIFFDIICQKVLERTPTESPEVCHDSSPG